MKWPVYVLFLALGVGCASSGPTKKETTSIKANTNAQIYLKGVRGVHVENAKTKGETLCPEQNSFLDGKTWSRLMDLANACVSQNKWSRVKVIADRLARQDGNSPWGGYYLSLVAEREGRIERAFWMIDLALKKAPQEGLLYYQKGRLHWSANEHELAMESFEKSIAQGAQITDAHGLLASVYLRDQEYKRAQEHFEVILKNQPGHVESLIGMSRIKSIQRDNAGAITYLRRAVEFKPGHPTYRVQLALMLEGDSQFQEALDHFRRVQSQSKESVIEGVNIKEKIISLKATVDQIEATTKVSQREPAKTKEVKGN